MNPLSMRPHLAVTNHTPERAYEQLLELMGATHSGVIHSKVRLDEDDAFCPINMTLWLSDGAANKASLPSTAHTLMEAIPEVSSGPPFRIRQLGRGGEVYGTGIMFATSTGVLQHLKLSAPFDHGPGNGERERCTSLAEPLLTGSIPEMETCLQNTILEAPRSYVAEKFFDSIFPNTTAFLDRIRTSFAQDGVGLRVQLKKIETWPPLRSEAIVHVGDIIGAVVVVANQELEGWAAYAECVAAMHFLLSVIEYEINPVIGTLTRPCITESTRDQNPFLDGDFRSYPDSWTFSTGVRAARELVGGQRYPVGLLDLGCGSAASFIEAIADNTIEYYIGVDIDPEALRHARLNLKTLEEKRYKIDQLDVTDSDAADRIRLYMSHFPEDTIWILGANLPYLPTPKRGVLDQSTDGGRRGLDLTPHIPLTVAHDLGIEIVVINISSLCDLDGFLDKIETSPFLVDSFIGTVAPLEEYASKVVEYVREQRLGRPYDSYQAQIISTFILQRDKGVSAREAMMCLERTLAIPKLQPELTVALGKVSGEIDLFTRALSSDSRALVLSVSSTETSGGIQNKHAQHI